MKPKIKLTQKTENVFNARAIVETEIFFISYEDNTSSKQEFEKRLLKFLNPAFYINGMPNKWKVNIYKDDVSLFGWKETKSFKRGDYITKDARKFKCVLI